MNTCNSLRLFQTKLRVLKFSLKSHSWSATYTTTTSSHDSYISVRNREILLQFIRRFYGSWLLGEALLWLFPLIWFQLAQLSGTFLSHGNQEVIPRYITSLYNMKTVTNLNIIPLQPVDMSLHIQITSLYATSISLTNMYFFANSNSDSHFECAVWHCNATATGWGRLRKKKRDTANWTSQGAPTDII